MRGIESGRTGGMEESGEPPGGRYPTRATKPGILAEELPCWGIVFRVAKILQIRTKEEVF